MLYDWTYCNELLLQEFFQLHWAYPQKCQERANIEVQPMYLYRIHECISKLLIDEGINLLMSWFLNIRNT